MTNSGKPDEKTVRLFVCGDIANELTGNGIICSPGMVSVIESADYSVCNFEAPVEGVGAPVIKPGVHKTQRPATIEGLKKCGFNLLLLANNHITDFGKEALAATMEMASDAGLDILGAGPDAVTAYKPLIKTINGIRIGMINACEAQFGELKSTSNPGDAGYAWISDPLIDTTIVRLRQECDFVIVFAHAGLEFYPIPQKEWRIRYKHFCDLGADVVVGSHPHVPQGYETYNNSLIFYSLGNFCLDHKGSWSEDRSYSVMLEISYNRKFSHRLIHHYRKDLRVCIATEEYRTDVEGLNLLLEAGYQDAHDRMVDEVYRKIRRRLAISTFLPVPLNSNFKDFTRLVVSKLTGGRNTRYKDLNLLHILKNETYYYIIRNALEMSTRRKTDDGIKPTQMVANRTINPSV